MAAQHHTLDAIALPRGMRWVDEFGDWTPVAREHEHSVTGALLIDVGVRQAGRPITLQAVDDQGWIRLDVLRALQALADASTTGTHVLTHADGRVFDVQFAPGPGAVTAHAVGTPEAPADHHPYVATVRLIEV